MGAGRCEGKGIGICIGSRGWGKEVGILLE